MPSNRLEKINELIRVEIGKIIHGEIDLEMGTLVTIVRVATSPTLEHATIWISVFPKSGEKEVLAKINKKIQFPTHGLYVRL